MVAGHTLHDIHDKLVVVVRKVGFLKNRSKLVLVGSNLVMPCFYWYPQFVCFYLHLNHELRHTLGNRSEIVVIKLLIFRCRMAHQSPACKYEVGTCLIKGCVDKEIFLLPTEICMNL